MEDVRGNGEKGLLENALLIVLLGILSWGCMSVKYIDITNLDVESI